MEPGHPLCGIAQAGGCQPVQRSLDSRLVVAAQPFVHHGHALLFGQGHVLLQPVALQDPVHAGVVAAIHLRHCAFNLRLVALLVAGLAVAVGAGALDRVAVQAHGQTHRTLAVQLTQDQIALAGIAGLAGHFHQLGIGRQRRLAGLALVAQPFQHRGFLLALARGGVHARETLELAVIVLRRVAPAAHGGGIAHGDFRIVAPLGLHQVDQRLVVAADDRVGPLLGLFKLSHQRIAVGAAGITRGHDEIAIAQRPVGEAQPVLRRVGHVVLGVVGRLAVRTHVGTVEGEVTGVARPHPVVHLAAEIADAARRRVHQAHVADFHVAEQAVFVTAVEGVQAAAVALLVLAVGNQPLFNELQRARAADLVGRGIDGAVHPGGDVADRIKHEDPCIRPRAQLGARLRRVEAGVHQVVLGGRVELDRSLIKTSTKDLSL